MRHVFYIAFMAVFFLLLFKIKRSEPNKVPASVPISIATTKHETLKQYQKLVQK